MSRRALFLVLTFASLANIGCATHHASWGDYSEELYTYYKAPTDDERAELEQTMVEVFERAEQHGVRPPPGLYAEYATFLLQSGDTENAIIYYDKERKAWPESTQFMSALIDTLNQHTPSTTIPVNTPGNTNEGTK